MKPLLQPLYLQKNVYCGEWKWCLKQLQVQVDESLRIDRITEENGKDTKQLVKITYKCWFEFKMWMLKSKAYLII